jgi:hypothetical protein
VVDEPEVIRPPEQVRVRGCAVGIEDEPIEPEDRGPCLRRDAGDVGRRELQGTREIIEAEVKSDTRGE